MKPAVVLSCEHAGREVPARLRPLFRGAERELDSHAGWDAGALVLARELARDLRAPLHACTVTRLVVDANRSATNLRVFSRRTRTLSVAERERLLAEVWRPHRAAVEADIRARLARGRAVLHLSLHSFAPRWPWPDGPLRTVDVGVLDDPARPRERAFSERWIRALRAVRPDLRIHRNRPYRGTSDGLTTALRSRFGRRPYLGLELEVSQAFTRGPAAEWRRIRQAVRASLREALDSSPVPGTGSRSGP